MIKIKRAYDPVEENDGPRFLVDRMWPRGLKKERLKMEAWLKQLRRATSCVAGSTMSQLNGTSFTGVTLPN